MKRFLICDFESRSDIDIVKSGSYKYMESPEFKILLLAYAFDDDPVKLVDLECGEPWPEEFLEAVKDPAVLKVARNAAFERNAIKTALGIYCPPEEWLDTAVLAAQCGLPRSLEGSGEALGLEGDQAKMKEGKALIRYFCIPARPTKANGGRRWNLPEHAPEKWSRFREYCAQDVVTDRIQFHLMERWLPSEEEHKFWCLDTRINEKGVRIDRKLAANAVAMNNRYKEELTAQAVAITGLENPKSVSQIKNWLFDQEGQMFPSLNKKVIADVVSQLKTEEARMFMELRSELSKSSTAKYEAMLRSQCEDGTVKGCFLFYGANRTGRFCLTGDHEVLTPTGWVRLDQWTSGPIAVWNKDTELLSFQDSKAVQFPYTGKMMKIDQQRCAQICTPEHKMPIWDSKTCTWVPKEMKEVFGKRMTIPFVGERVRTRVGSPDELRVLIMTQADGHYAENGDLLFHFTKERKIKRCKSLLRRAQIPFYCAKVAGNATKFSIYRRNQPLWMRAFQNKTFDWWLLNEDPRVIMDEVEHWDGHRGGPTSVQYCTTNKKNAEVMQAVCALAGYSATLLKKNNSSHKDNWNDAYALNVWLNPGANTTIRAEQQSLIDFEGTVYCAMTNTGYFLVRRQGKFWITGNSGKMVQFQNLPQNHMPDLAEARELVREGRYTTMLALYDGVSKPLSELIRTAIIPEEGHKIMVADFSAIEARVVAWFANEQWRLNVFESGGDIYCASASKMFHVPVVKHGVNGHLRQKGKVAELGLGYGGGVNALKAFGADKMGMSEEEMQETVDLWREGSPNIVALWRSLEKAAIRCVVRQMSVVSEVGNVRFSFESGILWMNLPSGRRIAYFGARYEPSKWDKTRKVLSYMGIDQNSKKWSRVETWGGKLTENLVQATARDCLREAMFALDREGYDIRAHVHDEVIATEPVGGRSVEEMSEVMGRPISWAPGLPLRADGYETPFYKKD